MNLREPAPRPVAVGGAPEAILARKFDRSVSLLAWAYNEEQLIASFVDRAIALLNGTVDDWEIVLVNDGSTDRTAEILDRYAEREPRLRPIHNDRNRNIGYSAYRAIQTAGKEVTFWQTVDWAYDLKHLRIFLELTRHFDVVQGIRPVPIRLLAYIPVVRSIYRIRRRSDNFRRAVVSLVNYYFLRILFGCPFHDFQNVTFYRRADIQDIDIRGMTAFSNPTLLLKSYDKGLTFIEVPIRFSPRRHGKAKGAHLRSLALAVTQMWLAWLSWGWRLRLRHAGDTDRRIFRVAEPFHLDEHILKLVLPLFKDFR